jgi:putative hemolysin
METREREAQRVERGVEGAVFLAERPFAPEDTVYDDARATALVVTRAGAPALVEEVGRLRSLAFADEAEATGERYGLDEYDDYCRQLVILDKASGEVAAGTRLAFGDEVLSEGRGSEAFYAARYWAIDAGMVEVARRGVEVGRTWVHPAHRKGFRGLALLWKALAMIVAARGGRSFLFGTVSLTGYPERSRALVANYLRSYHRRGRDLVRPWHPASSHGYERYAAEHAGLSAAEALGRLRCELVQLDPAHPVPVLLRHYARFGAELAGELAEDRWADKMSALLLAPAARLGASTRRLASR